MRYIGSEVPEDDGLAAVLSYTYIIAGYVAAETTIRVLCSMSDPQGRLV